jgi:hypothetical protein
LNRWKRPIKEKKKNDNKTPERASFLKIKKRNLRNMGAQ